MEHQIVEVSSTLRVLETMESKMKGIRKWGPVEIETDNYVPLDETQALIKERNDLTRRKLELLAKNGTGTFQKVHSIDEKIKNINWKIQNLEGQNFNE